jgi:hypothetical protein
MLGCALLLTTFIHIQPKHIQVTGTHFVLQGKLDFFVGTNSRLGYLVWGTHAGAITFPEGYQTQGE